MLLAPSYATRMTSFIGGSGGGGGGIIQVLFNISHQICMAQVFSLQVKKGFLQFNSTAPAFNIHLNGVSLPIFNPGRYITFCYVKGSKFEHNPARTRPRVVSKLPFYLMI